MQQEHLELVRAIKVVAYCSPNCYCNHEIINQTYRSQSNTQNTQLATQYHSKYQAKYHIAIINAQIREQPHFSLSDDERRRSTETLL